MNSFALFILVILTISNIQIAHSVNCYYCPDNECDKPVDDLFLSSCGSEAKCVQALKDGEVVRRACGKPDGNTSGCVQKRTKKLGEITECSCVEDGCNGKRMDEKSKY